MYIAHSFLGAILQLCFCCLSVCDSAVTQEGQVLLSLQRAFVSLPLNDSSVIAEHVLSKDSV